MGTESLRFSFADAIFQLRRWGTVAVCSAVMTTSLFAAEPVAEKLSPLERLRDRSPAQRLQDSKEQFQIESQKTSVAQKEATGKAEWANAQPASETPVPLDLPMSEFDLGRTSKFELRPARPAIVKPVPGPYFETTSGPGSVVAQPITLPDFLDTAQEISAAADQTNRADFLPPEPIAEIAQLPNLSSPDGLVPGDVDTVFRPISQIQPYYTYSSTGKKTYEYLCPQPSSIPESERARCPDIQPLPTRGSTSRDFSMVTYQWLPSDLKHKPLYFQDVALERYGQKYPCGLQPFVSLGKFAAQGIGLPYQMAIDPVWRDIYPLGYYRPGDDAPDLIYHVPINLKAAAAAGGVYTGLFFLIP